MSQQTGLFQRNGTFYLRFIIPQRKRHLFDGRSRIVRSLHTTSKQEANAQALGLHAQLLNPQVSNQLLVGASKTAHGKHTWIKCLLNFASNDLELIPQNT